MHSYISLNTFISALVVSLSTKCSVTYICFCCIFITGSRTACATRVRIQWCCIYELRAHEVSVVFISAAFQLGKKKKKNTHAHYKQFELLGILILENCLTWWLVLYLIHSAIPDWSETLITAIVVLNAFSNCFFNFIQKFLNLEWG